MALTQTEVQNLKAVEAKLEELKATIQDSLNLRAVGGSHISNEIIKVLPVLKSVTAAVEADIAAPATTTP